jgi:hypothetical protein
VPPTCDRFVTFVRGQQQRLSLAPIHPLPKHIERLAIAGLTLVIGAAVRHRALLGLARGPATVLIAAALAVVVVVAIIAVAALTYWRGERALVGVGTVAGSAGARIRLALIPTRATATVALLACARATAAILAAAAARGLPGTADAHLHSHLVIADARLAL